MPMSAEIINATEEETKVDVQKRAFMSKFGKYAAVGAGMSVLMTPAFATANMYGPTCATGVYYREVTKEHPDSLIRHVEKKLIKEQNPNKGGYKHITVNKDQQLIDGKWTNIESTIERVVEHDYECDV